MPSVSLIPKRPTYHRIQASFSTFATNQSSREIEKARAEWDALPKVFKISHVGKRRLRVIQSEIKGVSCCDESIQCERMIRLKNKHHVKCDWFGNEIKIANGIGFARLPDCLKEAVPPKETEE